MSESSPGLGSLAGSLALRDRPAPTWPGFAAAAWMALIVLLTVATTAYEIAAGRRLFDSPDHAISLFQIPVGLVAVGLAMATVLPWGRRLPGWLVSVGIWGAASTMLSYVVEMAVLRLFMQAGLIARDVFGTVSPSNAPIDWTAVVLQMVFLGVGGVLYLLAALCWRRATRQPARWTVLGICAGLLLLNLPAGLALLVSA